MKPPLIEAPASAFLIVVAQIFMLFCMFLALVFDVKELTLFALIILAMGLVSKLWSRASLNHLKCKIHLNRRRLFPDENLRIDIRVKNSKLLPVLFKVDLFAPRAIAGNVNDQWISEQIGLLWYQQTVFSRHLFPNKRGVYDLGPPNLRGGDLFGFHFRHQEAKDCLEVIVYPRIVNIRTVDLPKREFFGSPGAKNPVEDPVYVYGTRDYQTGRPARRIHWKASARHNRLQEKLCEPAEQEKVLLLLDVDGFEDEQAEDDFEKSLEVLASIVLQLDRRRIAVGFATNGNIFGGGPKIVPISRSPQQIASILEILARVGRKKSGEVAEILSKGYRIPGGASCLCFGYQMSAMNRSSNVIMKNRNASIQFIMAHKASGFKEAGNLKEKNTYYLSNLLYKAKPKR